MNEEEVKNYLKSKGYSWNGFIKFLRGSTVGINEDGSTDYYEFDVERYRE